jgi:hypothetical protein
VTTAIAACRRPPRYDNGWTCIPRSPPTNRLKSSGSPVRTTAGLAPSAVAATKASTASHEPSPFLSCKCPASVATPRDGIDDGQLPQYPVDTGSADAERATSAITAAGTQARPSNRSTATSTACVRNERSQSPTASATMPSSGSPNCSVSSSRSTLIPGAPPPLVISPLPGQPRAHQPAVPGTRPRRAPAP